MEKYPQKSGLNKPIPVDACQRFNNHGFTLLELLISVVLLVAIVSIAGIAMRLACRTVSSGETKIEQMERFRSSLRIIEAQIQSRIPLTFNVDGSRQSSFKGNRTSMQLATNFSIWNGQHGYVVVKYRVDSDKNGKKFLLAAENTIGSEKSSEAVLFSDLDDIFFEYYYRDALEEGRWTDEMSQAPVFPEKTRISIAYGMKKYFLIIPSRVSELLTP